MAYQVNITHFINPHLFYFCKINTSNYLKIKSHIEEIEQELSQCITNNLHPLTTVGDEVAVYFLTWKRFIRARVDYIVKLKNRYEYTVWALDYGFPFQTKIDFLYNLPKKFCGATSHIKRGGITRILPAENTFYMGEERVRDTENWHDRACTLLEDLLSDCFSVDFKEEFNLNEHYWGELTITTNLEQRIVLSELLLEKNLALANIKKFTFRFERLQTIKIERWLNNSRNHTCTHNDMKSALFTKNSPKKTTQVNADLTKDHIRKVNDWRCFNESSDESNENLEDNEINSKHLGISVLTQNAISREAAVEKFLMEKDNLLIDNLQNYETHKDKLPKEALLALNTSMSFEDSIDIENDKVNETNADKSKSNAELQFIEHLKKRGSLRKQRLQNESIGIVDIDTAESEKSLSIKTHKNNIKLIKNLNLGVKKNMIPAGMEYKNVKLHYDYDLPNMEKNSSIARSENQNLISFSSTSDSQSEEVTSKETSMQSDSSFSLFGTTDCYKMLKSKTKDSSLNSSSRELLTNSNNSELLADDEQEEILIKSSSKDETNKQDSCLDALLSFTKKIKEKPKNKYPLAIANADNDQMLNFGDECNLKIVDHMVLAHSREYLKSVKRLDNSYLIKSIFERMMNMKIDKIYRVQSYSWAHLMLKNSVFIVGANKTGKTWAYVPQICSLVATHLQLTEMRQRKKTAGPVAIILAASAQHVEYVANISEQLLGDVKQHINLNIVRSYGIFDTQRVKMDLLNGCGILIATAPSLQRLLADDDEMSALLNVNRLKHIVVDDLDLIKSRNKQANEEVLKKLLRFMQKQKPQLVVTTRHWEKLLSSLLKYSVEPVLLFGDFLEAAVYGRVGFCIKLCTQEKKFAAIMEFLQVQNRQDQRCLIFCNTTDEVDLIVSKFEEINQKYLVYDDRSNIEFVNIPNKWQNGLISGVLICMDTAFCDADIKSAHHLIHYSMPDTWTKFTKRFASIANIHQNILLSEAQRNVKETVKAQALILLDEENNEQLPRLIEFLQIHNQEECIHQDVITVSEHVKQTREISKVLDKVPLCNYLLEFGNCEESHCTLRHQITSYDAENDLPTSGDLQIHILKIHSVTHYSARVLRHKPIGQSKWENMRRSNEFTFFNMQMNMFYEPLKQKVPFWPLELNVVCIYRQAKNYQRAVILEVPILKHPDVIQNVLVTIYLIDQGITITDVPSNGLLVCEEKFKDFPAQAVNIRLQHIIPFDNERTWDAFTTNEVQKWLVDSLTKQQVVQVSVSGAFADTIFTKNVMIMEQLSTINQLVYELNLKAVLLEKNYAQLKTYKTAIDDMLEENMKKVYEEKKIEENLKQQNVDVNKTTIDDMLEENMKKVNEEKKQVLEKIESLPAEEKVERFVEKWIKLPLNKLCAVELGNENNNGYWNSILLQICNEEQKQIFAELSDLINLEVAAQKEKQADENLDFKVGQCCIIKFTDIDYYRAKIVDIMNINGDLKKVRFFLCDFAAFVTKDLNIELYNDFLYKTTKKIIEFTPYQAVHSTLAGINLRDLITEHYCVTKKYLHLMAVNERAETELNDVYKFLNINSYEVLLYESDEEMPNTNADMLNKALVHNGFANAIEEKADLLERNIEDFITIKTEEIVEHDNNVSEDEDYYDKMLEITSLIESLQKQNEQKTQQEVVNKKSSPVDTKIEKIKEIKNIELATNLSRVNVLKPLHKHPKVIWHQNDYFVFIIIHAPDVKDYYIKINENTVYYCAETNGEREMCILNLLDTIQTDHIWHELVGLNLKIRLLKTQFVIWPRLLQQLDKFPWLKYELDKVKTAENLSLARTFCYISGYMPDDLKNNHNDESDSDSEYFEDITTRTVHDDADPFADD